MHSKVILTIGGSDSGGGAGIQADLKTFMALKIHGCSVITCLTAQNSLGVYGVEAAKVEFICKQLDVVFLDFEIKSIKTGMLLNESIIKNTANKLENYRVPKIIDPVMVSRTGSQLLEENAIEAYKKLLFPQAEIVTPNIYEAKLLTNMDINNEADMEEAGKKILRLGVKSVFIKGGGIPRLKGKDFFIDINGKKQWLVNNFVKTNNTHGSGCTLSAAICGYLGKGFELIESINKSKLFVEKCLKNSYQIGSGPGPLGHSENFD